MNVHAIIKTLEAIAKTFPKTSQEYQAIEAACSGLQFSESKKVRDDFELFIKNNKRPLNGYELLSLRCHGLSIPEEQNTPEVRKLVKEMDVIAVKLQTL